MPACFYTAQVFPAGVGPPHRRKPPLCKQQPLPVSAPGTPVLPTRHQPPLSAPAFPSCATLPHAQQFLPGTSSPFWPQPSPPASTFLLPAPAFPESTSLLSQCKFSLVPAFPASTSLPHKQTALPAGHLGRVILAAASWSGHLGRLILAGSSWSGDLGYWSGDLGRLILAG